MMSCSVSDLFLKRRHKRREQAVAAQSITGQRQSGRFWQRKKTQRPIKWATIALLVMRLYQSIGVPHEGTMVAPTQNSRKEYIALLDGSEGIRFKETGSSG